MVVTHHTAKWLGGLVGLSPELSSYVVPAAAVLAGYFLGHTAEFAARRLLPYLASRSSSTLDDVVAKTLRGPMKLLGVAIGASLAGMMAGGPAWVHAWSARAFFILLLASLVVFAARLFGSIVIQYGERAHLVGSTRRAVKRIVTVGIYVVGGLWILQNQGIEITPLLTTLGLAGLAVALALQDTISNFFAGIYVQADRPLDVGHYVRLEDLSIEGFVVEVGWRTTKIRTLPNNIVVIPNSKVAASVVTDYYLPEPRMSLLVNVHVTRAADPRTVERLLVEEAKRCAEVTPGLLKEPEPFVRFIPGFTEQGYGFTLISQVEKFVDQYHVQHELRYRIIERLKKEGIELGYPVRVLKMEDGVSLVPEEAKPQGTSRASTSP